MTVSEAIDFLDGLLMKVVVNRETHEKILEAIFVLRKASCIKYEG